MTHGPLTEEEAWWTFCLTRLWLHGLAVIDPNATELPHSVPGKGRHICHTSPLSGRSTIRSSGTATIFPYLAGLSRGGFQSIELQR